jgi:hypothetical protein
MIGYKLFHQRKDGSLGSLNNNKRRVIPMNMWLEAGEHRTKGYQYRPGWHVMTKPEAPHLTSKKETRVWREVEIMAYTEYTRPVNQGGKWYLANYMRVIE